MATCLESVTKILFHRGQCVHKLTLRIWIQNQHHILMAYWDVVNILINSSDLDPGYSLVPMAPLGFPSQVEREDLFPGQRGVQGVGGVFPGARVWGGMQDQAGPRVQDCGGTEM